MSRERILKTIRENKPGATPLPDINLSEFSVDMNLQETFIQNLEASGGKVVQVKKQNEVAAACKKLYPQAEMIISLVDGVNIGTVDPNSISSASELDKLDVAILEGQFGVAENGAVWLSDKNFDHRSIPFITSHLVIVLKHENIVENMHFAYSRIAGFNEGYGVFIAGPSKTADIEQSLVIGAQAALSLSLILI